ncbi:hypothetical protein EYF80_016862 [Liparis tanakae]|uniref:Uncharacterized protein n=1 Tax=Liparis tanakae TaxID=230148 RepID=A0A4Z2I6Y4_9TELE|nr:hypothetical protein EYF80_016862 [Liparis tanakae]
MKVYEQIRAAAGTSTQPNAGSRNDNKRYMTEDVDSRAVAVVAQSSEEVLLGELEGHGQQLGLRVAGQLEEVGAATPLAHGAEQAEHVGLGHSGHTEFGPGGKTSEGGTSTLCWSGKLQFTLDSLVLPVCLVESYTLTLPTYSPTSLKGGGRLWVNASPSLASRQQTARVDRMQEMGEQGSLQTQHVPAQDLIAAAHGPQPLPVLDAVPRGHNGTRLHWDGALAWHQHTDTGVTGLSLLSILKQGLMTLAFISCLTARLVKQSAIPTRLGVGDEQSLSHNRERNTDEKADNSAQAFSPPHDDGGQNLASQKAVLDPCGQGVETLVTQHRYLVMQSAATHWKLEKGNSHILRLMRWSRLAHESNLSGKASRSSIFQKA